MELKIKKFVSAKNENYTYLAFVVDLGYRVLKFYPQNQTDFCDILNMKPQEISSLPNDFEKVFTTK